jgi:hypothetical protein
MSSTPPASDPNARPCFLHGHDFRVYADGSKDCLRCQQWHGPDQAMVNELLRAASGRKVWENQALILARLRAPQPIPPADPPLVFPMQTTENGSMLLWTVGAFVFTALALLGIRLGMALWEYLNVGHL